ncbi:amino acid adenylation domain-containing protein [Longimicrobium sp.]|uniref:amino acid adenylation domain-containing protein n=1 Tax=Longimicrobium sp. TaxID=2029185 RepID=UPI003B3A73E2
MNRKNVEDIYPLSPLQQGLLFHALYSPETGAYVEQAPTLIEGDLDVDAFARAFQRTVDRHPVLRTGLVWENVPQPLQVVFRTVELPVARLDWSGMDDAAWRAQLAAYLADDRRRGFELTRAPLLRLAFMRLDARRHVFVFTFHHTILDGWSTPLLYADVDALYRAEREGRTLHLPPAPRYRRYVEWLQQQDRAADEAFWRARLAGFERPTPLPLDRGGAVVAEEHAALRVRLSADEHRRLSAFARENAVTLNTLVQAAWALLLARWSGERDVVFGITVAGRPAEVPGVEQTLGLFINTVPLRVHVPEHGTVGGWLAELQRLQAGMRQHEHVSLVDVQGWSGVPRERPLFESAFVFENYPLGAGGEDDDGLHVEAMEVPERVNYALTLVVAPGDGLELRLNYDPRRFTPEAAERIARGLRTALDALSRSAARPLAAVEVLGDEERTALERMGRGEPVDTVSTFGALFAAQAARTPDAPALEFAGRTVTYAELEARANRLAGRLRARGAGAGRFVAVSLERSLQLPVAFLAVMKSGAAFLPIDPRDPAQRRRRVLADSGAVLLLTERRLAEGVDDLVSLLDVGEEEAAAATDPPRAPDVEVGPDDAAYVLYTSGSTGIPKGVIVPHRGIGTSSAAAARVLPPGARMLQSIPFTFDLFVMELGVALLHGGCLVGVPRERIAPGVEMAELLRAERINAMVAVPSMLAATPEADLPALRAVYVAGEALPRSVAGRWGAGRDLVNAYGPTEATIFCTYTDPLRDGGEPPIGRPAPGVGAWVLDPALRLMPPGTAGELYVGGVGVATGYLARPALTAERFLPDPFAGVPGARMYRTGDRARWRADGQLDFLGRADFQVKVRGFRIEPGEVEAALAALPEVGAAAVLAREDTPGDTRLVAYVTPAGDERPAPAAMRRALAATLPAHMVPTEWVVLDALPLNPHGKTDRRALPAPASVAAPAPRAPGRTPAEELVADIWERVLGVHPGAHDSFFELGGHSLRATQVVSRIREAFGADLPLRAIFEAPTVAELAARAVAARAGGVEAAPPLVPQPRDGDVPLSFAQQRFWFVERIGGSSNAYILPQTLRLRGALDVDALRRALDALVDRHESLRTAFPLRGGGPVQHVLPALRIPLPLDDLSALPGPEREREARRFMRAEMETLFDLERGPVLRARLLRMAADDHVFLLSMHHIAGDAWSLDLLFDELEALYAGERDGTPAVLPPLPVQYADFALWQRARLRGPAMEAQMAYWRERLAGAPTLELPTDRPHPPVQSFRGGTLRFDWGAELSAALGEMARRHGATTFMALLAGFSVLLHRWSGMDDVVVGTPIAGRTPRETEGLIGIFLNTLALRTDVSGDPTFAELLGRIRETSLDAFAHQEVPFERLVDELKVERSLARHPLFQVMFSMVSGAPRAHGTFAGLATEAAELEDAPAKLDLSLIVGETEGRLSGALGYAADLWDASTMRRMAEHLRALLAAAAADPSMRIGALPMMDADERRTVVEAWNQTAADVPAEPAFRRFEAWARRTPGALAVDAADGRLTYAELDARANRLAHRLRRAGVGPDARVALLLERSAALVAAQVAVHKAGGAYLPLDTTGPIDRAAYMLEAAGAAVVITRAGLRGRVPPAGIAVIELDTEEAALAAEPCDAPDVEVHPDSLAHVIFTSGSTGRPKGVAVPHRGVSNLLGWCHFGEAVGPGDRSALFGSPTFDVTVLEVWSTLGTGASLYVVPDAVRGDPAALVRWVGEQEIGIWYAATPVVEAAFEALRHGAPRPRALRLMIAGGDALRVRPPEWLRLVNVYGPTENTVGSTAGDVSSTGDGLPAIGRPLANDQAYVLDARLQPVPVGVPGELHLAGAGVARGYLGRPALTAERFIPSPFGPPGARMYATGDRVRWLERGELDFLGRTDEQVKLRGYRIETGEIEAALLAHPALAQAAVLLRKEGGGRLVAWVAPAEGAAVPAAAELREHLRARLPDYMVPSAFVGMDTLPTTPNGKVDRKALPQPAAEPRAARRPRSGVERRIAKVWEDVLAIGEVGLDDNFFEIGGHSMLVASMQERLAAELGKTVTVVELFQFPTVAALAAHLGAGADAGPSAEAAPAPAEAMERGGSRREMMRRQRAR